LRGPQNYKTARGPQNYKTPRGPQNYKTPRGPRADTARRKAHVEETATGEIETERSIERAQRAGLVAAANRYG